MPASRGLADRDFLVVFAFIALVVAEVVLVLALPSINYSSGDGTALRDPPSAAVVLRDVLIKDFVSATFRRRQYRR
jgi:hypothetical protein